MPALRSARGFAPSRIRTAGKGGGRFYALKSASGQKDTKISGRQQKFSDRNHLPDFISNTRARNPQLSEISSMIFDVGLPAPCPALVSMRISVGAGPDCAACSVAANLKLCAGTTRSSWSAVVINVGRYFTPGFMLCSGE